MERGLNQFLGAQLQHAVEELAKGLSEQRFVDQLVTHLAGRPADQRKALRRKGTLRARTIASFQYLREWGIWAQDMEGLGQVQQWEPGVSQLAVWACRASQEQVLAGECPLVPLASSSADALPAKAHEVWMLQLQQARLEEEVDLIREEQAAFKANLSKRLQVLQGPATQMQCCQQLVQREILRVRAIARQLDKSMAEEGGAAVLSEAAAALVSLALDDAS